MSHTSTEFDAMTTIHPPTPFKPQTVCRWQRRQWQRATTLRGNRPQVPTGREAWHHHTCRCVCGGVRHSSTLAVSSSHHRTTLEESQPWSCSLLGFSFGSSGFRAAPGAEAEKSTKSSPPPPHHHHHPTLLSPPVPCHLALLLTISSYDACMITYPWAACPFLADPLYTQYTHTGIHTFACKRLHAHTCVHAFTRRR